VTSGGPAFRAWLAWLAIAAMFTVVNSLSVIEDLARLGRPVPAWKPWTWEATSMFGWAPLVPIVFLAAARARPPRWPWPAAIGAHLALALLLSALHVAIMVAARKLVYAAAGAGTYAPPEGLAAMYGYEVRKDLLSYAAAAFIYLLIERLAASRSGPPPAGPQPPFRLEVRDGTRTFRLAPEEIEWAQAAGNYVALHTALGEILHRETLAALEKTLAPHGFRRIHRSRLVRADAVRAVDVNASGDFEVLLASGVRLSGSRRFRERVRG
jgi:DNA-binding LytR/AlgR family response regulator